MSQSAEGTEHNFPWPLHSRSNAWTVVFRAPTAKGFRLLRPGMSEDEFRATNLSLQWHRSRSEL